MSIGNSRSGILPVISGVPQGSILGPLLFLIYINDLPDKLTASSLLLFADDAKCFMPIYSSADCASLQSDLSSLADWSLEWKLSFNELKCRVLHFTRSQFNVTTPSYSINNTTISSVCIQKDFGVILSSDMQWRPHYILIMQKAYNMLGLVRRTFPLVRDVCAKHRLYISLIRSLLLYCSPLWRPQLLVDIKSLETVQRRATKFITDNQSLDYRERLLSLQMLPLMMEYEIADILFFIKSLKAPSPRFNIENYISFSISKTRSSYLKLRHAIPKCNLQGNFFFNRLPRLWNSLPLLDISMSIPSIRAKLRDHFWNHFIAHFDSNNVCTYHYLCPCLTCAKLPVNTLFIHM